ncbi:MAG: carboxypeptidase-like regulatory domain-containing protein [Bacteroidota bacterium]
MILRAGLLFLAITLINPLHAQISVQGSVIDAESKRAIPYANIGILNTKTGTVSNADGSYKIVVPDSLSSQRVIFSAIGYERQELAVNRLTREGYVKLVPKIGILKNIDIVADKKQKVKWLGNTKRPIISGSIMNYDSTSAGAIRSILIENEEGLKYVKKAKLLIIKNTLPEFKIRLRFLGKDEETGLPSDDLISESIILTSSIKKGWLTFDLSKHNIQIEDDEFFLAFEWLYEEKDRIYIAKEYAKWLRNHPEDVKRDTVLIDGVQTPIEIINKLLVGTFFGTNNRPQSTKNYHRRHSFDRWSRSIYSICAKVLMTD